VVSSATLESFDWKTGLQVWIFRKSRSRILLTSTIPYSCLDEGAVVVLVQSMISWLYPLPGVSDVIIRNNGVNNLQVLDLMTSSGLFPPQVPVS